MNARLGELRGHGEPAFPRVTTLPDGSGVWYAPAASVATFVFAGATDDQIANGLVVMAEVDVLVPAGVQVLKELYSSGSLDAGTGCVFRAVHTLGDANMGPGCEVLRWVNADGDLRVGMDSVLWGRASAVRTMSLGEGTRFQRIGAPRIEMGWPLRDLDDDTRKRPQMVAPPNVSVFASRWVASGDLIVPAGEVIESDVIVAGTLRVGRGARLAGAVRCDVLMCDEDVVFERSVIGESRLSFGEQCRIAGPVVVEGTVTFGDHSRIGSAGAETTISALLVRLGNGVVVSGEIWARRQGLVTPLPGTSAIESAAA